MAEGIVSMLSQYVGAGYGQAVGAVPLLGFTEALTVLAGFLVPLAGQYDEDNNAAK